MSTRVMDMARRLAKLLVESIKESPGHPRAFHVSKLAELVPIIKGHDGHWPTVDHLFDKAFQAARKHGQIVFREQRWYPVDVPVCPHCNRLWPDAPKPNVPSGGTIDTEPPPPEVRLSSE